MKEIKVLCDRCGAALGDRKQGTQCITIQKRRKSFKLLLYRDWMTPEARFRLTCDEMDLCVDCRKSFDNWLNGVEVK